jgi:predicted nucleic acid-binding protein
LYASLSRQGALIEDADIFIAAFCLVNDYPLVTNNTRHFGRIAELTLVDWT